MAILWCIILPQMPISKVAKISVAEIIVGRQTFALSKQKSTQKSTQSVKMSECTKTHLFKNKVTDVLVYNYVICSVAPQVSLKCSLIALTNRVPGTLSFTRNYLTFIADDTTDEYQEIAALVR